MSESAPQQVTSPPRLHASGPDPQSVRPVPIFWPLDAIYALFRPFYFYARAIERLSLGASVVSLAINLTLAVAIAVLAMFLDGAFRYADRSELTTIAVVILLMWIGALLGAALQALLYAPAVSGVASYADALKRSFRLVASTSAAVPVATAVISLLIVCEQSVSRFIRDAFGTNDEELFFILTSYFALVWPFALLLLGLWLEGLARRESFRPCGERRCDRCGYDLRIIPDEGLCPECGRPVAESFDPERRRAVATEAPGRTGGLAARLQLIWLACIRPPTFWAGHQVRRNSRTARNFFLCWLLLAAVVGAMGFAVLLAVLVTVFERQSDLATNIMGVASYWLFVFAGLTVGLVAMNHATLLLAMAHARFRRNALRHDELARVGYYCLTLPAIVEAAVVTLAAVSLMGFGFLQSYNIRYMFSGTQPPAILHVLQTVAWLAAALFGLAFVALALLALVNLVRALESARHANY